MREIYDSEQMRNEHLRSSYSYQTVGLSHYRVVHHHRILLLQPTVEVILLLVR